MRKALLATAVMVGFMAASAQAAPIYTALGTAAPPATLGPYTMLQFPPGGDDPRPTFSDVTTVPTPIGGVLTFSIPMEIRDIPAGGWSTWSHGYQGDVYFSQGATSMVLTMPAGTGAFYFYLEPNPFQEISFTVTASDGTPTVVVNPIQGQAGAEGFGFHVLSGSILSIAISGGSDFAIAEFGIAQVVPEPMTLSLFGVAALAAARRFRRKH